jgi:hypothetical protein
VFCTKPTKPEDGQHGNLDMAFCFGFFSECVRNPKTSNGRHEMLRINGHSKKAPMSGGFSVISLAEPDALELRRIIFRNPLMSNCGAILMQA